MPTKMPNKASNTTGRSYAGLSPEERKKKRKELFLVSALELFGTVGYKNCSVRALCRATKLTDRYFYESFDTVEDVLMEVYLQETGKLAGKVAVAISSLGGSAPIEDVIQAGLKAFFEGARDPLVARVIWLEVLGVSPRVDKMYVSSMHNFQNMVMGLVKGLIPDLKLNPLREDTLATAVVGAVNHSTMLWIINSFDKPIEELVEVNTMLMEGLVMKLLSAQQKN